MSFSGAVKLGDLNDFIAPSQACVVNLGPKPKVDTIDVQLDAVQLPPTKKKPQGFQQTELSGDAVKVSLQDCLACSGCVTSAETVLLEHQSTGELLAALQSDKTVIVSVSPQSRSSLGVFYDLSPSETTGKLTHFLKGLGVRFVLDTSASRDIALLEAAQDFIARYKAKHPEYAAAQHPPASSIDGSCSMENNHRQQSHSLASTSTPSLHHRGRASNARHTQQPYTPALPTQHQASHEANGHMPLSDGANGPTHQALQKSPLALNSHRASPAGPFAQTGPTAQQGSSIPNSPGASLIHGLQQPSVANGPTQHVEQDEAGPLPMLASACPGWVCYAEKTHGSYILPYISTAKSPQAVMGTLVKRFLAKKLGLEAEQIYHCAIMPCYDKKLEGSREDFMIPGSSVPETDSVLTTAEVQELIQQQLQQQPPAQEQQPPTQQQQQQSENPRDSVFESLPCEAMDSVLGTQASEHQLYGVHGGAGGYLEFIFKTAAQQLFARQLPAGPLQMTTLRNTDFTETRLEVDGRTVLRFAAAYGFRNIQTLVRKIKRKACEYDYVEIMACPSACLNGGGQIKARRGQTAQQLLDELDAHYHSPDVVDRHPQSDPLVSIVYRDIVGNGVFSPEAQTFFHTGYHHREKSVAATIGDW